MRRLVLVSSGAMALVVGCGLVGSYDYEGYEGPPEGSSSSSSSSNGASSSSSGTGGTGGMGIPCPPDAGLYTPEVCDNRIDDDCIGGDYSVKSVWSARYGDNFLQKTNGIVATADKGLAIAGEFAGILAINDKMESNTGTNPPPRPFAVRFGQDNNATFIHQDINHLGGFNSVAVQGSNTYVIGTIVDSVITTNKRIVIRKLDSTGSHMGMTGWELILGSSPNTAGVSIGTTNAVGAPVFIAGHIDNATSLPLPCPNPPTLSPGSIYSFVMSLDPDTHDCLWATTLQNTKVAAMDVTSDSVTITGFYTMLPMFTDAVAPNGTASYVISHHPSTYHLQRAIYINPQTGTMSPGTVSLFALATDENGRHYASGTFRGKVQVNGQDILSGNNGADFDGFAVALDPELKDGVLWAQRFGGMGVQFPTSLAATSTGVFMTGRTPLGMAIESDKDDGPVCDQTSCNFLLKLNPGSGETTWATWFGGGESDTDAIGHIKVTPTTLWLSSRWSATADFGNGQLLGQGGFDVVLAKFSPLP